MTGASVTRTEIASKIADKILQYTKDLVGVMHNTQCIRLDLMVQLRPKPAWTTRLTKGI